MLNEKVGIVTGGSVGIGRGVAEALCRQGARVAICGRRRDFLDQTAQQLEKIGYQILAIPADVTIRGDVEHVVSTVVKKWGKVDILVNNAGVSGRTPIDHPDDTRWLDILQVNLTGAYLCTKLVLPHMVGPNYGRVSNMSSVLGSFGVPGYSAYCTAKQGILGFTKAIALEVASRGITVNAICPTWVDTAMARQGIEETAAVIGVSAQEFRTQALAAVPIQRMAEVSEVAALALFLCSSDAAAMMGQAMNVCGGSTAGSA